MKLRSTLISCLLLLPFLSSEGDGLVVLAVKAERSSYKLRKIDANGAKPIGDKPHAAVHDDCTLPAEIAFAALARDTGDGTWSQFACGSDSHASSLAENTGFSFGAAETAVAATVINAASRPVDDEHISADSPYSALVGTAAAAATRIDLAVFLADAERLTGDSLLSAPIAAAAAPAASGDGRAARGVDGDAALAGGGYGGSGGNGGGGKGELGLAGLRASVVGLATSAEVRFVASLSGSIYDL
jgi:hypothetical protein